MGKKLARSTFPVGHSPDDFECFGPPATTDGEFDNTKIADLGCFNQEGVDSNKYYHGAITKSKKDAKWYAYFEYGRVGASNPQFQFVECSSEYDAQAEYVKQLESKNVKRGVWEKHATLGRRLVPKIDSKGKPKDLYIVRSLAARSTGLPDARKITSVDGATAAKKKVKKTKKKSSNCDPQTISLLHDLNVGTISYTRRSIVGDAIPTQTAIDDARNILAHATDRISHVGHNVDDQVKDKELKQLTRDIYGRIPKIKARNAQPEEWILNQNNILNWQSDLDAFEQALHTTDLGQDIDDDPLSGAPFEMSWVDPKSDLGRWIYRWWPAATQNRHSYIGRMKIVNVWEVNRNGDKLSFLKEIGKIEKGVKNVRIKERPMHQDKERPDLNQTSRKKYWDNNVALLFHATRTVNVSGILQSHFRIPKQLSGVVITGAMFGAFGTYLASDWKKSAGYSSLSGSYWSGGSGGIKGRQAFMFACDSILGQSFVAPGPRGYTSPPDGYHSVFGKAGHSGVQNDEYVVEPKQIKQKYLLEFTA